MGETRTHRTVVALICLVFVALTVGTVGAQARVFHHPPESCRDTHVGAVAYCTALEQRHALRVVRLKQVREVERTHVKFHRSFYRGWDVKRLRSANRWERSRLAFLQAQETWWPLGALPLGRMLAARAGWTGGEWSCLYSLWDRESGWTTPDTNSSSGAAGIPQALPPSKMGRGWDETSGGRPTLRALKRQILWGIGYIKARYGDACGAWAHSNAYNWY